MIKSNMDSDSKMGIFSSVGEAFAYKSLVEIHKLSARRRGLLARLAIAIADIFQ
jgi:hypothetical protein